MKVKVTVCQLDPREGQLDGFLQALKQHCKENRTQFLLLPEMSLSDWLAADAEPDARRWAHAVLQHEAYIAEMEDFGVPAIMGTRPILTDAGSRRNEAYLWTDQSPAPAPVHQKYYLPDEEGYWEHSWYDRGPKSFDIARALDMRIGVQICTEMWFFEWAPPLRRLLRRPLVRAARNPARFHRKMAGRRPGRRGVFRRLLPVLQPLGAKRRKAERRRAGLGR